jgi:hypothetical protein
MQVRMINQEIDTPALGKINSIDPRQELES